ncbi:MAG: DUF4382 domain-containing protein [Candidatus Acidiferrales bacterium]
MSKVSKQLSFLTSLLVLGLAAALAGCGGGGSDTSPGGTPVTGTISTSLSDPPICKGPLAPSDQQFERIIVTITKVRAHISSSAGGNDGGWVDLVDLTSAPRQIDLLSGADTQCILAMLGSTTGLPAGNYQQIRVHLLSNNPPGSAAVPSPNLCDAAGPGPGPFNCVEPVGEALQPINLSSQDQTGLKVPPGRIAGGRIMLEEGQAGDIDINIDACRSIVRTGNGQFRLLPTLHAGEVMLSQNTLSGKLVALNPADSTTAPIPTPATMIVFAEQPDSNGVDRVVVSRVLNPDGDGSFSFCPLVGDGAFDVVGAALDANGVTYNATIVFNVPPGTNLGNIGLAPESGASTAPATLEGVVSSQDGASTATAADVSLSALQAATPSGGSERLVTIPTFGESTLNVVTADSTVDLICPANTKCAEFTLNVPASNPRVGTFSGGSVTFAALPDPLADILYRVNGLASVPGSEEKGTNCTPPSVTVDKLADGTTTLTVTAGNTSTTQTIAFTGCQAGQ